MRQLLSRLAVVLAVAALSLSARTAAAMLFEHVEVSTSPNLTVAGFEIDILVDLKFNCGSTVYCTGLFGEHLPFLEGGSLAISVEGGAPTVFDIPIAQLATTSFSFKHTFAGPERDATLSYILDITYDYNPLQQFCAPAPNCVDGPGGLTRGQVQEEFTDSIFVLDFQGVPEPGMELVLLGASLGLMAMQRRKAQRLT